MKQEAHPNSLSAVEWITAAPRAKLEKMRLRRANQRERSCESGWYGSARWWRSWWHARLRLGGCCGSVASSTEQDDVDGKQRKERTTGGHFQTYRRAKSGGERCAWHAMVVRTHRSWRCHPRARVEAGGSSPTMSVCLLALFKVFTELPLASFFKLLLNLYGNSKISKNKSCSKFKVLQLCFNNHTQILSRFENASLKSWQALHFSF